MIVYVLSQCENCEGGSVHGVYRTRASAERAAARSCHVPLGAWYADKDFNGQWSATINHVDFMTIERMEVR
jgi:hypothetical protein